MGEVGAEGVDEAVFEGAEGDVEHGCGVRGGIGRVDWVDVSSSLHLIYVMFRSLLLN